MKRKWLLSAALFSALTLAACGDDKNKEEIHIGYFPNMTHITTIVALEKGFFTEQLGADIEIKTSTFPDGGSFMEAMSTGNVDYGTVGPTPALNTYLKNPAHEIIAGAVNGGAVLVTRADSGIESIEDLKGKKIAIPTFGSTQDIGLRKTLQKAGLTADDVELIKQAPADTAALFLQGEIDAAATQEPWGVNIETNAGANLLEGADEFAWGNESTNTVVVATTKFSDNNPELTEAALRAHVQAVEFIEENRDEAIDLFLAHIEEITGKALSEEEVTKAFDRVTPTTEVKEDVLQEMAKISLDADYTTKDDITGLVNLEFLEAAKQ
ncbi:ABC transporter substrate-binding protein [Caryophanon latum]|uniref:Nitrate ABC transporter substrate-binding protein n=1 Tax=Caryophanon latum TaxID=33977 RepID=A0A1C0YWT7_9BACL|nr:aliphatic sulfonate ABC transporter substrate-binding protein [Caryophanon latum]OCS91638.1 nitrate ABC transporter substrate-binding protein [Caryophanon latum]